MPLSILRASIVTIFTTCFLTSVSANPSHKEPPMIDGQCDEYSELGAMSMKIDDAVTLQIYQNQHFVWLCYNYPDGSYGTLDMIVDAPGLKEAMNLHISAQLGEWPAEKPDMAPSESNSPLWWNHKGWTANEVWFNGYRMHETDNGEEQVANWRNAPAREIQLSKTYFGRGEWKLRLDINAIQGKDDKSYSIVYPSEDKFYTLKVN